LKPDLIATMKKVRSPSRLRGAMIPDFMDQEFRDMTAVGFNDELPATIRDQYG
jgi:hypothetical protein